MRRSESMRVVTSVTSTQASREALRKKQLARAASTRRLHYMTQQALKLRKADEPGDTNANGDGAQNAGTASTVRRKRRGTVKARRKLSRHRQRTSRNVNKTGVTAVQLPTVPSSRSVHQGLGNTDDASDNSDDAADT